MSFYITKNSGEKELFSPPKLKRSLERAGLSNAQRDTLMHKIAQLTFSTTKELHNYVISWLHTVTPPLVARYNLKEAIMQLGPDGFFFEQFIGRLFHDLGYAIKIDQHIQGFCVLHEIDMIAEKEKVNLLAECKFHNRLGLKTDVKVTLYTKASFDDIKKAWLANPHHPVKEYQVWVISNTQFTTQAITYAQCSNIHLLGWSYPENESLPTLIDRNGLYPITVLDSLNHKEKELMLSHGILLCREIQNARYLLEQLHFTKLKIEHIVLEAEQIYELRNLKHEQ